MLLRPRRAQEEILARFSVGWSFENPFAIRSEPFEPTRASAHYVSDSKGKLSNDLGVFFLSFAPSPHPPLNVPLTPAVGHPPFILSARGHIAGGRGTGRRRPRTHTVWRPDTCRHHAVHRALLPLPREAMVVTAMWVTWHLEGLFLGS